MATESTSQILANPYGPGEVSNIGFMSSYWKFSASLDGPVNIVLRGRGAVVYPTATLDAGVFDSRMWLYEGPSGIGSGSTVSMFNDDAETTENGWSAPLTISLDPAMLGDFWSYLSASCVANEVYYLEVSSFTAGDNFAYDIQFVVTDPSNVVTAEEIATTPAPFSFTRVLQRRIYAYDWSSGWSEVYNAGTGQLNSASFYPDPSGPGGQGFPTGSVAYSVGGGYNPANTFTHLDGNWFMPTGIAAMPFNDGNSPGKDGQHFSMWSPSSEWFYVWFKPGEPRFSPEAVTWGSGYYGELDDIVVEGTGFTAGNSVQVIKHAGTIDELDVTTSSRFSSSTQWYVSCTGYAGPCVVRISNGISVFESEVFEINALV